MIKVLFTAYVITCFLEILIALRMKVREKRGYLLILLVNLLTNPLANLLYYGMAAGVRRIEQYRKWFFADAMLQWTGYDPVWLLVEFLVILGEGVIYHKFREWIPHPWRYAVIANLISAMAGIVWFFVVNTGFDLF